MFGGVAEGIALGDAVSLRSMRGRGVPAHMDRREDDEGNPQRGRRMKPMA
jgi:hypothetical protein